MYKSPNSTLNPAKEADFDVRDWFAGQALNALLGRQDHLIHNLEDTCEIAYRFADAMLRKRDKT